ncbi:MAG: hypothetical protein NTW93_06355, partial [Phycisphaerae bacterium]|nr:hypothetical protein [Phycisphaerae bacterium]
MQYAIIILLWLIRLIITSEQEPVLAYGPHDALLYVERAFNLVNTGTFGSYNSRMFLKNPLISYILYGFRQISLPYHFFLELTVLTAAVYALYVAKKLQIKYAPLIIGAGILFLPATYDNAFFAIGRDGLSPILTVICFLSLLDVFTEIYYKNNKLLGYFLFPVSLSILVFLREEGKLFLILLLSLAVFSVYHQKRFNKDFSFSGKYIHSLKYPFACMCIVVTFGLMLTYGNYQMYGIFLHNDFSGGEFPSLINSLRRIKSEDQSRYVSIPRSSLEKVAKYIPEMRPVLNVYPAPPGKNSYFYKRYGVYDQWPDSHNLIWIKDAIFNAKVATDAKDSQLFYKNISNKIDLLCEQKVLNCTSKGKGLIRAPSSVDDYLLWINGFYNSILVPFTQNFVLSVKGDNLVNSDAVDINTKIMVGNEYAYIAMTSFDSLMQFNEKTESRVPVAEEEKKYSLVRANLIYWLLYPDVAVSNSSGVNTDLRGKISSIAEVNEEYIVSPLFNKKAWMNYDYKLGLGLAFLVQNESYARLFASSIQSNERLGGEVHYMNCGR